MDLVIIIPPNNDKITWNIKRNRSINVQDVEDVHDIHDIHDIHDNTMWSTAIYEVLDRKDICFELLDDIRDLTNEMNEAIKKCDFSQKKATKMEERKKKILEGVHILRKYEDLVSLETCYLRTYLHNLFLSSKAYVSKKQTFKLLKNFETQIRNLKFDVNEFISSYRLLGVKEDPLKIIEFKRELVCIKKKIKFFQEESLNKKEIGKEDLSYSVDSIKDLETYIKEAEEWVNKK